MCLNRRLYVRYDGGDFRRCLYDNLPGRSLTTEYFVRESLVACGVGSETRRRISGIAKRKGGDRFLATPGNEDKGGRPKAAKAKMRNEPTPETTPSYSKICKSLPQSRARQRAFPRRNYQTGMAQPLATPKMKIGGDQGCQNKKCETKGDGRVGHPRK
jgi:hypothetical protein